MPRFQSVDEIYSVLYVDFDNIYTRLSERDLAVARVFATDPQRWLRWIEGHALRMLYGDNVKRRILKRCCYLNPHRYHEFRPFFIRAAFQVIDCPPLTNYGKTSADIQLVMDCMGALAHPTRFDEFIILSGDADFTPLLLRIQEYARRSLVLSVGYTSPAYVAACSWKIREDWFIAQALSDNTSEEFDPQKDILIQDSAIQMRGTSGKIDRTQDFSSVSQDKNLNRSGLSILQRSRIVDLLKQLVAESTSPVPLSTVSHVLHAEDDIGKSWLDHDTLMNFIKTLDIAPLELSTIGQGYLYDLDRHPTPEESCVRESFKQKNPTLYEFALKAHHLTDIPLFSPSFYSRLFSIFAEEISKKGYSRADALRNVAKRCEEEEMAMTNAQLSFVIDAIIHGGCDLTSKQVTSQLTGKNIGEAFLKRAIELCRLSQFVLSNREKYFLEEWLLFNYLE